MPQCACTKRHMVVGCVLVSHSVCLQLCFLGGRYKLGTRKYNMGKVQQYLVLDF